MLYNDDVVVEPKNNNRIANLTWDALAGINKSDIPYCARCSEITKQHSSGSSLFYTEKSSKMIFVAADPHNWEEESYLFCKVCGNKITLRQLEKQKEEAIKRVEQKFKNQKIGISWDSNNKNMPLIISQRDSRTKKLHRISSYDNNLYDDVTEELIKEIEKATGTRVARFSDYTF